MALALATSLQGQATYSFSYDAAGNRSEVISPYPCSSPYFCKCPDERENWLTLTATPDGANCLYGCAVTAELVIPAEYNCNDYIEVIEEAEGESAVTTGIDTILWKSHPTKSFSARN